MPAPTGSPAKMAGPRQIYVALFGPSEVGKTTYLSQLGRGRASASVDSIRQFNGAVTFSPGARLRKLWTDRKKRLLTNTTAFSFYDYRVSHIPQSGGREQFLNFSINDCRGEQVTGYEEFVKSEPLQDALVGARAFLLFIDNEWLTRGGEENIADWYSHMLGDFTQNNEALSHVPVAIVVSKVDEWLRTTLLAGVEPGPKREELVRAMLRGLRRTTLIPADIPLPLLHAGGRRDWRGETAFDRLRESVLLDHANNSNLMRRQLVDSILRKCRPLLEQVFEMTYRYQIFLLSTLDDVGVYEPLFWIADQLFFPMLKQEQARLTRHREKLKGEVEDTKRQIALLEPQMAQLDQLPTLIAQRDQLKVELQAAKDRIKPTLFRSKEEREKRSPEVKRLQDKIDALEKEIKTIEALKGANVRSEFAKLKKLLTSQESKFEKVDSKLQRGSGEVARIEADPHDRLWRGGSK